MNKNLIELNSRIGIKLGLTTDYFESATVWNAAPSHIYVIFLRPRDGREEEAYTQLLERCDKLATPVEFTAPSDMLKRLAMKYGYVSITDPAGTPRLDNGPSKFLI